MTLTYSTTWSMAQASINALVDAGKWNSWILQVDGTTNRVTWLKGYYVQESDASIVSNQIAYAIPDTSLTDGAVLNLDGIVTFPVNLGSAYIWNGTAFLHDTVNPKCDRSSIKITNTDSKPWVVGLLQAKKPICADTLSALPPVPPAPAPQPVKEEEKAEGSDAEDNDAKPLAEAATTPASNFVVYTPTMKIFVTVAQHEASSVVSDVSTWTGPLEIISLD